MESVADNVRRVRDAIAECCVKAGRPVSSVVLCAVSKMKPLDSVNAAWLAGVSVFGENYVREISEKFAGVTRPYGLRMIGHLQSNKISAVLPLVDSVDSVDSLELLKKIDARSAAISKVTDVLLEVNSSGDASKSGYRDEGELMGTLEAALSLKSVRVRGFMTMGPASMDGKATLKSFEDFARLADKCSAAYPNLDLGTRSFGMSGDFELAIRCGSNMVRIGRAIFGERNHV